MVLLEVLVLALSVAGTMGYIPPGSTGEKGPMFSGPLLQEVIEHMGRHLDPNLAILEEMLDSDDGEVYERVLKDLDNGQFDYISQVNRNRNPVLRDQEFLQHSSLWGHQNMAGGAGEGEQHLKPSGQIPNSQQVKTDAVLPAYCNPPNPCPVGYTEEQGCISIFENTAAFSRDYQMAQRCMCDGEHMFSCPADSSDMDLRFQEHKNHIAKKFEPEGVNPFLTGERLPIAAKKGVDV